MKIIRENEKEIVLLKTPDPGLVKTIQSRFRLTEVTSKVLANRGMNSLDEIEMFLSPLLKDLPNPFLFRDMQKIVERIYRAIQRNESILIYGDYDVDGITSTTLLMNFFHYLKFPVRYYLPNRFDDGYGLNEERLLELFKISPFHLLITVDCGISNDEIIKKLHHLGVDTIVTDHHQSDTVPVHALGVLNPALQECPFPFKELAGVGVVFFLVAALRNFFRKKHLWSTDLPEPDLKKFLDVVGIGTIADMVPLKGVNRILVNAGLNVLTRTENSGLKIFLERLNLQKQMIAPWEVAFQIAPRFNAAGRLGDPSIGVSLLTSRRHLQLEAYTKRLETLNRQRQAIEENLLQEAIDKMEKNIGFISPYAIVLWGEKWHEGVIGIVASKLVERFQKPAVLVSMNGGIGKGSVRGVSGTDIYKALKTCENWLISFGGHPMAGGFKIPAGNVSHFATCFSQAINEQLDSHLPKKTWVLDDIVQEGLPEKFFSELSKMEPFGVGNPPPLLGFFDYEILLKKSIRERHIRLTIRFKNGLTLQGIAFNAKEKWGASNLSSGIIGEPSVNHWNGKAIPQIKIKTFL